MIALLLAIVLRSLVAPLYLVASIVLSYLASLGLVGIVFVHLGGQDGINFILPFLMFVFLMALGSDYNILIMSRIREEAHELPLRDAVARAIGRTGSTITTAGMILGGTFAVLAVAGGSAGGGQIQQIGYGVAAGVLMDTFLVRSLLVPSLVVLLGRWNWWPSRLAGEADGRSLRSRSMIRQAFAAGRMPGTRPAGVATTDTEYQPGVCNIGPAEIARRRRAGHVGLLVAIVVLAAVVAIGAPPLARLIVGLPVAAAASGYLQAWLKFCAGFGSRGLFNFGSLGETQQVPGPEARARDRARATQIGLASLAWRRGGRGGRPSPIVTSGRQRAPRDGAAAGRVEHRDRDDTAGACGRLLKADGLG